MKSISLAALTLAMSFVPAAADSYWEVEAARANARAGGPVSERDAELLGRYGCLSGTRSAFCENLRYNNSGYQYQERKAKRAR